MDKPTVTWTVVPSLGLTSSWDSPTDTVLTLDHAAPFMDMTVFTVTVTGMNLNGMPLVPGPVPNPWQFSTTCPLPAPASLQVSVAGPDVRLSWEPASGCSGYRVYGSQDRFAAFPSGWSLLGTPTTPSFLATGDGADDLTHYYLVRGTAGTREGPSSTMGVKTVLSFTHSTVITNVAWFSLPYDSGYATASDVANALGLANIDVVGKWDPAEQRSSAYYYARNGWRGTDFAIGPGDGLYVGVRQSFEWVVAGTDLPAALDLALSPDHRENVNWISVPYTGVYSKASDISTELGSSKITEVGLWNADTQTVTRWYWSGTAWTGTDFAIAPGAGVYLIVASDFTWRPTLITPAVP